MNETQTLIIYINKNKLKESTLIKIMESYTQGVILDLFNIKWYIFTAMQAPLLE